MVYQEHELASLMPVMGDGEYAALVESIGRGGVREPGVLLDGKLLDGRHRQRACLELGAEFPVRELAAGVDPVEYVLDANIRRRHLAGWQRAMIGARLSEGSGRGGDRQSEKHSAKLPNGYTQERAAAAAAGVSVRMVGMARRVLRSERAAELERRIGEGEMSLSAAAQLAGSDVRTIDYSLALSDFRRAQERLIEWADRMLDDPGLDSDGCQRVIEACEIGRKTCNQAIRHGLAALGADVERSDEDISMAALDAAAKEILGDDWRSQVRGVRGAA